MTNKEEQALEELQNFSQKRDHAGWPNFTLEETLIVAKTLYSDEVNYLAHNNSTAENPGSAFERAFAEMTQCKHAISVFNGTVALDLALQGLKIGLHNGGNAMDEVIVTARTFIASVSAVVNAGAVPIFADVDLETSNIDPQSVREKITMNTRAVMCVHLNGWPCDMDALRDALPEESRYQRKIYLIEDAAQAHGAIYKGKRVGSLGDVAAWSFCQDKIMTTGGEGGMVTCDDTQLYKRMWAYKDHGKDWDLKHQNGAAKKDTSDGPDLGYQFHHTTFGTNWRMMNMQAELGLHQLGKLESWNEARHKNAKKIAGLLSDYTIDNNKNGYLRIQKPSCSGCDRGCDIFKWSGSEPEGCRHGWYKLAVFIVEENLPDGTDRTSIQDDLKEQLKDFGTNCMMGTSPAVYLEDAFKNTFFAPQEPLANTEKLGWTCITFQIHPGAKYPEKIDLPACKPD